MSFPKKFKQVFLAFVATLVVTVFGVGFGFTSASAAVPKPPLDATNFVVQEPHCGILAISFDYVGGPDGWYAKRDATNGGPTIASGSVTTTTGNVSDLALDQPAGTYDITLYGSSSGTPIANTTVTVYDMTTCTGQLEATNFVGQSPTCGTIVFSFDYTGGPDDWFIDRDAETNGPTIASGSVSNATGTVSHIVIAGEPTGTNEYYLYGSRGGIQTAKTTVTVDACVTPPSLKAATPNAPTFSDKAGTAEDTYSVVDTSGVTYLVGNVVTTGTHPGTGIVTVTAEAQSGYVLQGTRTWAFEFTNAVGSTSITPAAPTFTDKAGTAHDTYTVPSMVGVEYLVDGVLTATGTYPGTGTVTITARPTAGYVLNGTTTWTFQFTDVVAPLAVAPTTTTVASVVPPAVAGQPALNPGFGAKTGWGEDTRTPTGNSPFAPVLLTMAGLAGLAFYLRRKTGEQ